MWKLYSLAVVGVLLLGGIPPAVATTAGERLAGKILIDAPRVGDIWYVHPTTRERYYLGADVDAEATIRQLAVRINAKNIAKIPTVDESIRGSAKLRKKFAGYFLLAVEAGRTLWYESPWTWKRKPLSKNEDLQTSLLRYGIQVSNADLRGILLAADSLPAPSIPPKITTVRKVRVATARGTFSTTQILIDRRNQHWQLVTDTADDMDCIDNCAALSVRDFVRRHNGVAGIQGTYFCASLWGCAGGLNSFLWPVFKSSSRTMINQTQVNFTADPMVIFDTNNKPHYLPAGSDFGSLAEYEQLNTQTIQAAISSGPAMVEDGFNVLNTAWLDSSQRYTRSTRTFLGWHDWFIYLVSVRSATLPEATDVAMAMQLDFALNLDGGSSGGLYNDGSYVVGPGRNVPNAIVVDAK